MAWNTPPHPYTFTLIFSLRLCSIRVGGAQRYNYAERVATCVDDYVQRSRTRGSRGQGGGAKGTTTGKDGLAGSAAAASEGGAGGQQQSIGTGETVGWGCPRVRYVVVPSIRFGGIVWTKGEHFPATQYLSYAGLYGMNCNGRGDAGRERGKATSINTPIIATAWRMGVEN